MRPKCCTSRLSASSRRPGFRHSTLVAGSASAIHGLSPAEFPAASAGQARPPPPTPQAEPAPAKEPAKPAAAKLLDAPKLFIPAMGEEINVPDGLALDKDNNVYLSVPNYVDPTNHPGKVMKITIAEDGTKACLEYFYPKMIPGGIIISHDYSLLAGVEKASDSIPTGEDMMKDLEDEAVADVRGSKVAETVSESSGGSKVSEEIGEGRKRLKELMEDDK